ncbi:biotin/lipoyl-containing protein, partial [Roseivivax sp. CAU 1761]
MATEILMPALSPAMEEGTLARWFVREGDAVEEGDVIAEIETDKATLEFEATAPGRLGAILVPEGTRAVKVNTPIAVLEAPGEPAAAPGADGSAALAGGGADPAVAGH